MELHAAKAGEADQSRFTAQDETGKPANPDEAIVPILKQIQGNKWQLIGTGFFITVNGLLASAKHVLTDVLDHIGAQTNPIAIFQFVPKDVFVIRPLLRCVVNNAADVAIGVAAPMNHTVTGQPLQNRILTMTTRMLSEGEPVFTYAYPNTVHEHGVPQAIYFNPRYYEGRVSEFFPEGRDKVFLPKSNHMRLAQRGSPYDTEDVATHPCSEETPPCLGAPYSTSSQRSRPRCWPRSDARGTAIGWPSISCCDVRLDVARRILPPSCSARAPLCTARCGPIARAPSG